MRVLKNIEKTIDFNNFTYTLKFPQDIKTYQKIADILRKNNISSLYEHFNTRDSHKDLDIAMQIKKYDSVWINEHNVILAFWDHKSEVLYY